MARGGARQGAGAKKGSRWKASVRKDAVREAYVTEVTKQMAPLVRAQLESAVGTCAKVAVAEMTDKGIRLRRVTDEQELAGLLAAGAYRVFLSDPDLPMSRYLTDQVVGKATEHVEVSGPGGSPIPYQWQE